MVQFHILDVYTQDFKIEYEDEFEKKGTFDFNDLNDGLSDSSSVRKKVNLQNDTSFKYEMVIHLFGMTSDGKSLRVSVNGFEPYFYVELPNERAFDTLKVLLKDTLKKKRNHTLYDSIGFALEKKEKLYGYTNKTNFPFVKLSVRSKREFYTLKKCFLDDKNKAIFKINGKALKVYEANLDPMLRFFHLQNLNPCGWAEIEDEYNETIDIHWLDIKPITSSSGVAPFCCAFWDIECYSSSGDFPVTKKNWSKIGNQLYDVCETKDICIDTLCRSILNPKGKHPIDGIYLKGSIPIFERLKAIIEPIVPKLSNIFEKKQDYTGNDISKLLQTLKLSLDGDPIIQIGIVLTNGPVITDKYIFVFGSCAPIESITVKSYPTEKEMILGFVKFCYERNPDMFIGYNIFGFDNKYLFERMQELGITQDDSFQGLSRVIDIMDTESDKAAVELQEKFLSSSALGDNTLYLLTTTGRLHIDLYYYIKRIENLSSYKLDDVCRHYMSGKLKSINITNADKWFINTNSTKDAEIGKYIVLLDDIGDTIIEKRKIIEIIDGKSLVIEPCSKSYSISELESITKWAIVKDDVSPAEIFRLHTLGPDERAIVAKYCIQDCLLVQQLYNKLDVFNNAMAMANTCSVPVNYIFTRGQGIKCESLIFKECALRNQLIEVLVNPDDTKPDESYEGAIVLVPEPNFYHESPIGVADFASLYPSTIISENISYDTLLWSKDYTMEYKFVKYSFGSEEDEKYLTSSVKFTDIEFDIWAPDPNDKRKQPEKLKTGIRICRYVQQANDVKGSLPDILTKLLTKRKERRKEAEKESDPFKKALLDAEQLAYKLTANSLYGQLGSSTFKIRLQHLAASTTAYGRKQILFAKDAIERFYGAQVQAKSHDPRCSANIVYGDSVTGYTPVIIRRNNLVEIINIEELGDSWVSSDDSDKEFCNLKDVESWTENGWTPIERVIRHTLHPSKKIIRVLTHTAIVDVTDDHSLLKSTGEEISPKYLKVGDQLLHHPYPQIKSLGLPSKDDIIRAKIDGFFVGDGSCGYYDCPSGLKASWALNNSNMELLTSYKTMCETIYPDMGWVIMPTLESSGVYKLSPRLGTNKRGTLIDYIKKYRELYYVGNRKNIPSWILNGHTDIQTAFWNGFYDADGDKDVKGFIRADQKNQSTMAQLAFLASNIGYTVSFNTRTDKPNVYRLTCTKLKQKREPNAIKKLYELPYTGYVYDLTTANHHFHAGVGKMIVHNTDSLFINFNVTDPVTGKKLEGKKAIEATMELTEEAGKFVTRCLKKPHDFEYDKVFYPFLIFSKKRYVGNKYEDSSDNFKQTSMGIATKRRDYAAIVKNVYGGAIYILLNEKNPIKAFHFVQKTCDDLIEGKLSNHQITLSKSLRSEYKAVTPPAHKILAERIKARDPGNAPASGDRLEFMYILPPVGTKSQGDRVETPSYIKEKGLKIDYKYYIEHQIYNPIVQLFSLFVDKLPGYTYTSKVLSDVEKERLAGDLLFGNIFNKCDKQSTLTNLGFKRIEKPDKSEKAVSTKPVVQAVISSIQKKQTMINMNSLTNMFLEQMSASKKEEEKQKKNKKNTVSLEV